MLDFTELSKDGQDLELLAREILFRQGLIVNWSGKGADGGRDLTCVEARDSFILPDTKRWLVQCKHNAHGGGSVGVSDLDGIVDSCSQHDCAGYLLVCSTQPSSAVVSRLESIGRREQSRIYTAYWDAVKIEQILSTPKNWALAQRFFPKSSDAYNWQVFATEKPNHWVVILRGYYFHLQNRIGSSHQYHLGSLNELIDEIESIRFPNEHFLRIRSVFYDDKNGNYVWYLDYMYPRGSDPLGPPAAIADLLGDGGARSDGQLYNFDVRSISYSGDSDHYDPDHYDYYEDTGQWVAHGLPRPKNSWDVKFSEMYIDDVERQQENAHAGEFERLELALGGLSFVKSVRGVNAQLENIDKFHARRDWQSVISKYELYEDRFFSVWFFLVVADEEAFHKMLSTFPLGFEAHFRVAKLCLYLPNDDDTGSERMADGVNASYDLTISMDLARVTDAFSGRSTLNAYLSRLSDAVEAYRVTDQAPTAD
ncbi:restriction endonuclease [Paraburkholderia aspalathi]|uniref:restriction endonuclease n=1 Tax=Paraburkholderia aspalathi TaxID=1324617 RepID=UPI0038BAD93D